MYTVSSTYVKPNSAQYEDNTVSNTHTFSIMPSGIWSLVIINKNDNRYANISYNISILRNGIGVTTLASRGEISLTSIAENATSTTVVLSVSCSVTAKFTLLSRF